MSTAQTTTSEPKTIPEEEIIDERGRIIKLRKVGALEQSRIVLMVGADAAMNPAYMAGYVFPVCSVREIDGDAVMLPAKRSELELLIQRLDSDGINAILNYVQARAERDREKNVAEEAQLKN